jgi:hypothetical protein
MISGDIKRRRISASRADESSCGVVDRLPPAGTCGNVDVASMRPSASYSCRADVGSARASSASSASSIRAHRSGEQLHHRRVDASAPQLEQQHRGWRRQRRDGHRGAAATRTGGMGGRGSGAGQRERCCSELHAQTKLERCATADCPPTGSAATSRPRASRARAALIMVAMGTKIAMQTAGNCRDHLQWQHAPSRARSTTPMFGRR